MTTKTIGKSNKLLQDLYNKQIIFQKKVLIDRGDFLTSAKLPIDSLEWYKYHSLAMMEEMGEVLKADKRWKTHRNARYEKEEKLDEIADVFITAMNIAIYSGFNCEVLANAIEKKIDENNKRLEQSEKEN